LRRQLENLLERWAKLCFRRPLSVCLVVLGASLLPISQLPKVEIKTSTESLLHPDDPILITYNDFRNEFGRDGLIFLGVETESIFDRQFLEQLKSFHEDLEATVPQVEDVTSLINVRSTRGEEDELVVEGLFELIPESDKELARIQARALGTPFYRDLLYSRDHRHTMMAMKLHSTSAAVEWDDEAAWSTTDESMGDGSGGGDPSQYLSGEELRVIVGALFEVIARHEGPDFRVHAVGQPVAATKINEIMREDVVRFLGAAIASSLMALYLLFRRLSASLLSLITVGLSILSTVGLMAIFHAPLQAPTQVLPAFLLSVGVCCTVHFLTFFYQALGRSFSKKSAMAFALVHSGPPLMMTTLTTAGAVASFASSPLLPVTNLGYFASAGVILALVYTLTLLPALIALTPMRESRGSPPRQVAALQKLIIRIALLAASHPRRTLGLGAVVFLLGVSGIAQTRLSYYPLMWFSETERTRLDAEYFDRALEGGQTLEILLDTGRSDGLKDPHVLARLEEIHDYNAALVEGDLFIGKTTSIVDVIKETHRALNDNLDEYYALPGNRALTAQELLLFENTGSDDLEDFVDSSFRIGRMTLKVPWIDAVFYTPFIDQLDRKYSEILGEGISVTTTGLLALDSRAVVGLTESLVRSYVIAFAVIVPMMIIFLQSLRWGLASMLPNLIPIVSTVALMGWMDLPLDSFTLLTGSIAIGLAVDDTIHIMLGFRRNYARTKDPHKAVEETLQTTGEAVLFTTLILTSGFLLFVFGQMVPIVYFGLLTGFALAVAFLADITLGPALLTLLVRDDRDT